MHQVGEALREIRDNELYLAKHTSFFAYCPDVWGMSEVHANRLISASSIAGLLDAETRPIGHKPPSESVARELAPLKAKPKELIRVWQQAVEEHGTPTAAQVRKIVKPIVLKSAMKAQGYMKAADKAAEGMTDPEVVAVVDPTGLYLGDAVRERVAPEEEIAERDKALKRVSADIVCDLRVTRALSRGLGPPPI